MLLDQIIAAKRALRAQTGQVDLARLREYAKTEAAPRDFAGVLRRGGDSLSVIAEFKRKSPSRGKMADGLDPALIASEYQAAGAAALSVLTDRDFFDGDLVDIQRAKAATHLPVLRKDFLLDERDVVEARLAGADAVLLIVRILSKTDLARMIAAATELNMAALVEAHSVEEMMTAQAAGASIIGINHRDLDTLKIDLGLSLRARELLGDAPILVAESGLKQRADLQRLRDSGIDAALIGESLLTAPSPGAALAELLA